MIRNLVAAEGVKLCQFLCHLATLLPDPVVATSVLTKSAPSLEEGRNVATMMFVAGGWQDRGGRG